MHRYILPIRITLGSVEANENKNRLLRPCFPKKIRETYTSEYLADCRQKFNTKPRKCLGCVSSACRFFFEPNMLHLKVEYSDAFYG